VTRKAAAAPRFDTVWRAGTRRLQAAALGYGHGTADAAQEAAWLLVHSLGWPLQQSFAEFDALQRRAVPEPARQRFDDLLTQRIATRKPAAYLLGEAWLAGERFLVDERVIVPRSFIAELLGDGLDPWLARAPRRIADICTGSGCLAILAALRWPRAEVVGIDISTDALEVAHANLDLHGLRERVKLLRGDLLQPLGAGAQVDLMLCNPPYVNAASMRELPDEYRHEPELALAGGGDGMDLVRRLLRDAASRLSADGVLVVEIGNEREHFEAAFPQLPVVWMPTSMPDAVFLVEAAALGALAA
jgi:ribosomal protein L3 glutamine methyltransferase